MSEARPPRRWHRAGLRLLLLLVAALLLLVVAVLGALRSPLARRAILDRVARTVETSAGVSVQVGDFSVHLGDGSLELTDVALAAPGSESRPFLFAQRVRVEGGWRALLEEPARLTLVLVERPRFDVDAPLPSAGGGGTSSSAGIDIEKIQVIDGLVRSSQVPASAATWMDAWRVEDVALRGSFLAGRLDAGVDGTVRLESRRREPIVARLTSSVSGSVRGALEVHGLKLEGPGLSLSGDGEGSWSPPGPDRLAFRSSIDAGTLFPDLTGGGELRLDAALARHAERLRGDVSLHADGFPAELLRPLLAPLELEGLDLEGSVLRADAKLGIAPALEGEPLPPGWLRGSADLAWTRGNERLLVARAAAPAATGDAPVRLEIAAQLLPDDVGSRSLRGRLRAPSWSEFASGAIDELKLDVDEPRLMDVASRLGLVAPGDWVPEGGLVARVEAEGPLRNPRIAVNADWNHDGLRLVTLRARSAGTAAGRGSDVLDLRFDASVLPDGEDRIELEGRLSAEGWSRLGGGRLADTRIELDTPDLAQAAGRLAPLQRALVGSEPPAWIDRLATISGPVQLEARAEGALRSPVVTAEAVVRPSDDERLDAAGRWELSADRPWSEWSGAASLTMDGLLLSRFLPEPDDGMDGGGDDLEGPRPAPGRIDGTLRVSGPLGGLRSEADAEITGLRHGELPAVEWLHVRANGEAGRFRLEQLKGRLQRRYPWQGPCTFEGHGELAFDGRIRRLEASILARDVATTIDRVAGTVRLDGGTLHVESLEIDTLDNTAVLSARLPLGMTGLGAALEGWPVDTDEGEAFLTVNNLEIGPFLELIDPEDGAFAWRATVNGSLALDRADLQAARGTIELSGLSVEVDGEEFASDQAVRLSLEGGRVVISSARIVARGETGRGQAPLDVSGRIELAEDWEPDDGIAGLVREIALRADGVMEMGLLNPLLYGGVASGKGRVAATLDGPLTELTGEVVLDGEEASLFYGSPYPSKFTKLRGRLVAREGRLLFEDVEADYNGGKARLDGSFVFGEGLELHVDLSSVRHRLDYGAVAVLSGTLDLEWPLDARRRLAGEVVVERAVLRRDINLNREVLRALFEPDPGSTAHRLLDTVDLNLTLTTDEGLQIRNNIADLRADWGVFRVGGTLANPLFSGRVEVDPGGRVNLLGQTLRIDEGSMQWSGQPPGEPRMDFETTSSLQDPTIRQDWQSGAFASGPILGAGRGGSLDLRNQRDTSGEAWQALTTGLLTEAQSQLVSGLDRTELRYEPLPLFGETDTQARYTLAQHLSPNTTFIASTNPREAEAQTYIIDLHNFYFAPRIRAQLFTNDAKNEGVTLQHTLRLGGKRQVGDDPRVRSRRVEGVPEDVSKRKIRRAMEYRKGDELPRGSLLDVEVDVAEALRRRGYPDATAIATTTPASKNRVNLKVDVEAGERVRFEFDGVKLSRSIRRTITDEYHSEDEAGSVDAVRVQTTRMLQGLGYLEPQVTVTLEPPANGVPCTLRVSMDGGRRIEPEAPEFRGVPAEVATALAAQFVTRLGRVELATGEASADRYLLAVMRSLGYPDGQIVSRELSDDGERIAVELEPGERMHIVSIEIVGVDAAEAKQLAEKIDVAVGDPAVSARITRAAHALEDDLRNRGFAEARVRALSQPASLERPLEQALRFEVVPGVASRLGTVRFEGLKASRPRWVEKIAGLEEGAEYSREEIAEARGRLYRTGVFSRIRIDAEDRQPDAPAGERTTDVTFELDEAPRYQISYGGRWERDRGLGVVVDALDRNSLGRGHWSGVRVVYGSDKKRLRLYHRIPRVTGPKGTLELFVETREDTVEGVTDEGIESWIQLTFPLSARVHNRLYTVFQTRKLTAVDPDLEEPLDDRVISPRLGWQVGFDNQTRTVGARRKGLFAALDISGSSKKLGSDLSVLSAFSQVTYFLPIGGSKSGRFTWAQSWRVGSVDGFGDEIPMVDRLRAGGEFSVRGYPTDSLGPRDADGNALGGEFLFVVNQELHSRVWGPVTGLVFFDAGNVWETRDQADGDLFKSTGLGVRYVSPVGPLRLDVAWPFDPRPDDPDYKVYFGFGNVF